MLCKAAKQAGQPRIPLVPVVAPAGRVEFEPKVTRLDEVSELAVCREQAFLFAARQKKVWSCSGFVVRTKTKGSLSRRVWLPADPKMEL